MSAIDPQAVDEVRLRRWRLVLGDPAQEGCGVALAGDYARIDEALTALFDPDSPGGLRGGSGASTPSLPPVKWRLAGPGSKRKSRFCDPR